MALKLSALKDRERKLVDEGGSAVLLSLILAFLVVGLLGMSLDGISEAKKRSTTDRISGTRTAIQSRLKLYCTLPATFRASLSPQASTKLNENLSSCILGQPALCQAGVAQPVFLYLPVQASSSSSQQLLAGPVLSSGSQPVRMDIYGNFCSSDTLSPQCPFEVSAVFTATCAAGASTCARATSVGVTYKFSSPPASGLQLVDGAYSSQQMSIETIDCPQVSVASILPTQTGTVVNYVQVQTFTTENTTSSKPPSNSVVIQNALNARGVTDAQLTEVVFATALAAGNDKAIQILDAALSVNTSDSMLRLAIASNWVADAGQAAKIAAALTQGNVTKYEIQLGLAGWGAGTLVDPNFASAVNNALAASNITDNLKLIMLAHDGVTDPSIAIAMASTSMTWGVNDKWSAAIAAQLAASGPMSQADKNSLAASLLAETLAANPPSATTDPGTTVTTTTVMTDGTTTGDAAPAPPAKVSLISTCTKKSCGSMPF